LEENKQTEELTEEVSEKESEAAEEIDQFIFFPRTKSYFHADIISRQGNIFNRCPYNLDKAENDLY